MYDFAHESDYIEQISHSICTLEFVMHRELYIGFDQIYNETKVRPRQYEFARLNLNYTVMSKRKLLQLVQENVDGWDDPRLLFLD
jgi:glutaminyl-tRNA synthetase